MTIPLDLIGMSEACKLLAVSRTVIKGMVDRGELPAYKAGTRWRFSREDVEACLVRVQPNNRRVVPTRAELRKRQAEVDKVLREAGIKK